MAQKRQSLPAPLDPLIGTILIAGDNNDPMRRIAGILRSNRVGTITVSNRLALRRALNRGIFSILILGPSIEGVSGIAMCREIRTTSTIPIVQLTAAGEHLDAIVAGADYCLGITADPRELLIHLQALFRRTEVDQLLGSQRVMLFDRWRIDPFRRHLSDPNGESVSLSGAEFDLLLAFCRRPGRILSRRALLEATHIGLGKPMERSVDVHVSRLRRKLAATTIARHLIKTVRLGGYIFTASVELE
jgi:two-component system OmpR family response regulator